MTLAQTIRRHRFLACLLALLLCLGLARLLRPAAGKAEPDKQETPALQARQEPSASAAGAADVALFSMPPGSAGRVSGAVGASAPASSRAHHDLFQVTALEPDCTRFSFIAEPYRVDELTRTDGRYAQVRTARGWPLASRGKPALPVYRVDLLLPEQGAYELQVLASEYVDLPSLPPLPSAGMQWRSASSLAATPAPAIYGGAAPFPAQVLSAIERYRLRAASGLAVQVAPFQYLPAAGMLRVYTRLELALRCSGSRAEDYPPRSSEGQYAQLQDKAFLNAALLRKETAEASTDIGSILLICPDAWKGNVENFVEWKERIGFRVLMASYPADTGTGAAAIKAHIQETYEEDAVAYVLLCGDEKELPPYERSTQVNNPGVYPPTTDIPYAWVDGDDVYADLFLSRLPATSGAQLGRMLSKLRHYEELATAPELQSGRGLFVASNESGYEGISTGKKDRAFLEEFRQSLLSADCIAADSPTQYAPEANINALIAQLDEGASLVYYLGHGYSDRWTTTGFNSAQAKALSNDMALPLVVTPVCNNGNFAYGTDCLAEAFFKASDGDGQRHGAAAVLAASSETYWNPPIYLMQEITDSALAAMGPERLQSMGAYSWAGIFAGVDYSASSSIEHEFDGVIHPAEYFAKQMHLFGDASQVARLLRQGTMALHYELSRAEDGSVDLSISLQDRDSAAPLVGAALCAQAANGQRLAAGRADGDGRVRWRIEDAPDSLSLSVLDASVPFYQQDIDLVPPTLLTSLLQLPAAWPIQAALELNLGAAEWSLVSGELPPGIVLSSDGLLSGSCDAVGSYELGVYAVPQSAPELAREFPLLVEILAVATIDGDTVEVYVGKDYDIQLSPPAAIATAGYRLVEVAGEPPAAMLLLADGRCVGQPAEAGVSRLRLLYHNAEHGYCEVSYKLLSYVGPGEDGDQRLSHQELLRFLHAWQEAGGLAASRDAAIARWAGMDNATGEAGRRRIATNQRTVAAGAAAENSLPPAAASVGQATPWRVALRYRDTEELQSLHARGLAITALQHGLVWLELSEDQWQQLQKEDHALISSEYLPARRRSASSPYLEHEAMNERLLALAAQNWQLCRPDYVGQSSQGRSMLALRLGASAADAAVPELLLTGAIHGDERPSAMLALRFVEELLQAHAGGDERVRALLARTAIWVMPMVNPDGVAAVTRSNANHIDLNRDFPDGIVIADLGNYAAASPLQLAGRQPETQALMRWCASRRFSAALHLHTGARLVSYPYGNNAAGIVQHYYAATPDDTLFRQLAEGYATNNTAMASNDVINGSAWYLCEGEFGDWQYRYLGTLALTVELMGPNKEDADSAHLERLWQENAEALLSWAEQARSGVVGQICDQRSGLPIPHARISVAGTQELFADRQGRFHRVLPPGTWQLSISAPGYADSTYSVSLSSAEIETLAVSMALAEPAWLEARFTQSRYLPSYDNELSWQVQSEAGGGLPDAWIVSCVLPPGWAESLGDDDVPARAARWDTGDICSWLFLREEGSGDELMKLTLRGVDDASADGVINFLLHHYGVEQELPARHWLAAEARQELLALRPGWNFIGMPLQLRRSEPVPAAFVQAWRWLGGSYQPCNFAELPAFSAAWLFVSANEEEQQFWPISGWQVADAQLSLPAGWTAFACDWPRPPPVSTGATRPLLMAWQGDSAYKQGTGTLWPDRGYWLFLSDELTIDMHR
jgi:hypothetical protein